MGKFIQEFKEFAVKGNAVDMAVGVIIGGAFGKIVSSIVDDIIMPPIGWLIGGVKFSDLKIELPAVKLPGIEEMQSVSINYGNFLQTVLDFLIIAFCALTNLQRRKPKSLQFRPRNQSRQPKRSYLLKSATC